MTTGEWLSTPEAAELFHVSPDTLKRWHRLGLLDGKLEPDKTLGGHWRWPAGAVRRWAASETFRVVAEVRRNHESEE